MVEENEGERKRVEEALRASEEKFRGLFETMAQGVVYQDADGRIVSANPAAERILGLTLDQMQGRTSTDPRWRAVHEDRSDYPGETHPAMVALRTGKEVRNAVMGVFNPESEHYHWISIDAVPQFKLGEAKPFQVYTTFEDITERKRMEEEIRGLARFPSENLNPVLRLNKDGVILVANPASKLLLKEWGSEVGQVAPKFWRDLTADALSTQQDKNVDIELGDRSYTFLVRPVKDADYVNLYGRDIAERKRIEDALRESEENFRALAGNAFDGIMTVAGEGVFVYANERAAEITGYSAAELLRTMMKDLVHPDEFEKISERYRRRLEGRAAPSPYETVIIRKDGRSVPIELAATRTIWQRNPADLVFFRDITERKRVEEALRESEHRLRRITENMLDMVVETDLQGVCKYASHSSKAVLGYDPKDLVGKSLYDLVHPEDVGTVTETVQRALSTGRLWTGGRFECRYRHTNGHYVWLENLANIVRDEKGEMIGSVIGSRDITERKRMEEALRRSEERFRGIFATDPDCVFVKDAALRYVQVNPAMEKLAALPASRLVGMKDEDIFGEEASKRLRDNDSRVLNGEIIDDEETVPYQGVPRTFHTIKVPLRERSGNIIGVLGTGRDITERKRVEEALRESVEHEKLLGDLVRNASVAIGVGYPDGRLGSCNPAFSKLTGYTEEGLKMIDWNLDLTPPEWRELTSAKLQELVRTKKAVRYEKEFVRRDGSRIPVELVVHPKYDSEGDLQYYFTFVTDISERRQSEEALRESEEKYRELFVEAMDGIALADADTGILLDCNQALAALVGRNRAELIGQPQTILHPQASDNSALSPTFKLHLTTRAGQVLETQVITGTGDIREVEIKASLVYLQGRKMLQGTFRDITERKRAEEAQRRRVEELAALQATVLDITGHPDLATLLQTIVERAARLLDAPAGGMYLCDPEKQVARCVVSYNTPHDYTGAVLKYGEGAAGIVAQTGKPLIVDDYHTWQGRATMFEEERPFTAVLTVPMIWQGRVTGLIHILDDTASRHFTRADQDLLTLFANHAAIAVENARLLEEEKRNAEELARYSTDLEQLVFERTGKLTESERRFRELADLLPQIVFEIDGNGNVQYMNRAGFAATGLSEEELGKGLNAFRVLAPSEHDRATRGIERVMTGEMIGEREFNVLRKDGTAFPVLVYTAPMVREGKSAGLRGIAIDITDRKRAEEEIRAAKRRLDYVITSNPAVIITGRPHGDLADFDTTYMSSNLISMLGYEPEQFIKDPKFWARHVHPDDGRRVHSQLPRLFKEGHVNYDYRFLHKDGKYRWVHEEVKAIRDSTGKPAEVIGYWTDITQQKQMEQELAKAQRFATIGETAAMVGHDLRNPLTGMMGATHYLRTKDGSRLSEKGKEMLQLIDEDILRSDKIINDLLEFSGEIHLELSQNNAKSITEDALGRIRIPRRIRVVNSTKKRPTIDLDVGRMRRVFLNIIRNALDAMPEGGTLTIASARSGDNVHITFRDTGEGMTTESLRKLWSPLFTTKAKGMGLGLPISKRFVKAHGGTITVKTKPGKGSAFTVTLPLRQEEVKPEK